MKTKMCRYCCEKRPLMSFTKNASAPDGLGNYCRDCLAGYRQFMKYKGHKPFKQNYEVSKDGNEYVVKFD